MTGRRFVIAVAALSTWACSDSPTDTDRPPFGGTTLSERIRALAFGTGPVGAGACPWTGRWSSFPRGTEVTVVVSTTVSQEKRDLIVAAVPLVGPATGGAITAIFTTTDDPDPSAGQDRATITTHPAPSEEGCGSNHGCTIPSFRAPGVLLGSRAVMPASQTPQAYVHDVIGHGVLGLCHIDGKLVGGPSKSLMSGGPGVFSDQIASAVSPLDREVLGAIYGSDVAPGSPLQAFVDAGLIDPE